MSLNYWHSSPQLENSITATSFPTVSFGSDDWKMTIIKSQTMGSQALDAFQMASWASQASLWTKEEMRETRQPLYRASLCSPETPPRRALSCTASRFMESGHLESEEAL